ncbi:MAG: UDP-N-acetylmuramate dehydrogenase [Bacteroidetes bacterium]|nr:UDP-N-acetylmuramate dehydrogenase [Bacteroidota bacterium]
MFDPNVSLKEFNTFGISVKAAKFTKFGNLAELKSAFDIIKSNPMPFLILGGGSNLLLTKDFEGYVLKNELTGFSEQMIDSKTGILEVGAGENWHQFVLKTIENGWCGLENLSLIPGNVGASPMQNIGAYGVEIKDHFEFLEAFHIESEEIHRFSAQDCNFGYRESVFKRKLKNQYVITKVAFRLTKDFNAQTAYGAINDELKRMNILEPTARDVSNAVINIRQSKLPDPKEIGNAGSFFKNPVVPNEVAEKIKAKFPETPVYEVPGSDEFKKLAAGWLIETAGLKGHTIDNHGVHKKQALVLVNYGGATGKQIFDLSTHIIQTINEMFGVELEREVNIL